jgi:N-acyl-D-aspartate/D-glutamate deacylase
MDYDLLIKGGTIVDGTRIPAYRGDVGIRGGRIVAMGRVRGTAGREIDAEGLIVAPGFMDLHTHYDAALAGWDPYASLSGWHGVTTVAIGNCGFGFAPVRPEDRDRAMLRMERTESIPLSVMQAGMRWDWETFPEYLDSLEGHGIGVNAASLIPYSPLRAYVIGNEASRDPDYVVKPEEMEQMKRLLKEGLEAGGFGFSATFSMGNRDYDGGYLPTHVVPREEWLEMAEVLGNYNRGFIEWTMGESLRGLGKDFLLEMARVSGRPVNWNAIQYDPGDPDYYRKDLEWTEKAYREAVVLPLCSCIPNDFEFTMDTMGLFDQLPAWNEATIGTVEERKAKLADPARRAALRADSENTQRVVRDVTDGEAGQISQFDWDSFFVAETALEKNRELVGRTIADIARELNKHPADALLDLSVEEDLKTEFNVIDTAGSGSDEQALAEMLRHPLTLLGISDGGAHTKFIATGGGYNTYFLSHWIREKQLMSLEEAHWRMSTMLGWAMGIRDRGWLREGMPADIVVYDLDKLQPTPIETVHDLPGGDWRRVQKAEGYHYTIVNGAITFEGQECTGALPGNVLRSYDMAV